ncbi:Hypothetical_protein [Hexamita inflata]|uniref:Hypothetical_protein n=1 Tax=Hexamita inflata TaxID=28002 RepID=A0AA86NXE4_9EUKA|nr:Hypothetical protein HINF_LOCUS14096 [Hexamita inflata]
MLLIQRQYKLVECISQLLQIEKCAALISFYVLMLPDNLYDRLFAEVALLLETDESVVHEQFKLLALTHLLKSNSQTPAMYLKSNNVVEGSPRTQSKNSIQFQNLYSDGLQKAMRIQESDNKKLCHQVESHLKNNCSTKFWGKMHELIPDKTALQLRQYFHNSFARFMHQQYLSRKDRAVLKELMLQLTDRRPSEIADEFLEMTRDKNYFKRNVVMQVINMRTK